MKAVILAAGFGTRIRPLSATVPKPMVPVVHKPVMEFMVDLLRQHGFTQIIMSTAYLASDIESYFRDGSRFGVEIAYSFEGYHADGRVVPEGLGAAGGLKKIQQESAFFDDTFLVVCGDVIVDLDLTRALAFHRRKKAVATMVLKDLPRKDVGRYGVVETAPDGRILRFEEKPAPEVAISTTVNTGIYFFEPAALDCIPAGQPFDIAWEFFPRLIERGLPFYGLALPFTWIDVGSIPDYWRATHMVLNGELDFVELPGKEIAQGVWAGLNLSLDLDTVDIRPPVSIASGTKIDPGATIIGPTVIGRNCSIESGAFINACVIGDYTRVSGLAHLDARILSGRFCVDRLGRAVELSSGGYTFVVDDARERRRWSDDQQTLIAFLEEQAMGNLQLVADRG
jgi:mannose-1-phosphate guanylyltransferase